MENVVWPSLTVQKAKKDWIVIDNEGHSHKLRPQRVEYEVTGGPYSTDDIPQVLQDIQPYLDPSSLEVAWELLVEEGEAVTPTEMASFLFSQQTPTLCYAAHRLLCDDKIYFKKKGDNYEPRSPSQVEEIKHQLEVEQQRQQEKEVFFDHIHRAMAGETVEWTESDRTRLELLEKFVLQPEQNHRNAQDLLKELGRATNPDTAFELLVELGWWSPNENLFLKRSSYPLNFPKRY
jgi:exoribonuclease-2